MIHEIEIKYKTGNSFGSHEETCTVGAVWFDLPSAKKALQDIREHYGMCEAYHDNDFKYENYHKDSWFDVEYPKDRLVLTLSDGTTQIVSAFWMGYFETLVSAKIISEDMDTEFIPC